MTYEEFYAKEMAILNECKPLMKELKLNEFNDKMNELVELQEKYIQERNEMQRKGGQSRSDAKRKASAENGKKGGRPRKKPIENE